MSVAKFYAATTLDLHFAVAFLLQNANSLTARPQQSTPARAATNVALIFIYLFTLVFAPSNRPLLVPPRMSPYFFIYLIYLLYFFAPSNRPLLVPPPRSPCIGFASGSLRWLDTCRTYIYRHNTINAYTLTLYKTHSEK